jgi:hypothetical protein
MLCQVNRTCGRVNRACEQGLEVAGLVETVADHMRNMAELNRVCDWVMLLKMVRWTEIIIKWVEFKEHETHDWVWLERVKHLSVHV